MNRRMAVISTHTPASTIRPPSVALLMYSALPCPYWWPSSGGRTATTRLIRATLAATTFTTDSAASEKMATDPVTT